MTTRKSEKKSLGKKVKNKHDRELSDNDLDDVAGGTTSDPTSSESLDDLDSRKRPGRVKSLRTDP